MNKIIFGAMANKFLARVSSFTGVFNFNADVLLCLIENDLISLHSPMNTPICCPCCHDSDKNAPKTKMH
jgi:hypothetical protein